MYAPTTCKVAGVRIFYLLLNVLDIPQSVWLESGIIWRLVFINATTCRSVSMQTKKTGHPHQYDGPGNLRCTVKQLDRHWSPNSIFIGSAFWLLALLALYFSVNFQAKAADNKSMPVIDTSTTKLSEKGRYEVSFNSMAGPIEINTIHEWRLTVLSVDRTPIDGLSITVEGGMPMHDHGLPTAPRVTESLGEGQYRVEGFKFQMPGHWTTTFNFIDTENFNDSVTFNLML